MKNIIFTKMVASGNDFIVLEFASSQVRKLKLNRLAQTLCDRKFGIGADGLLLLDKPKHTMRIFNADGSEAEMCGNGARCVAYVIASRRRRSNLKRRDCSAPKGLAMTIETKAGVIKAKVCGNLVKIQLTCPKDIKLDIPLKVNGRQIKVNFVNTGVPHVVVFVHGIESIDVRNIGNSIRHHAKFAPAGANVNFVEPKGKNLIQIRTYERGVEDETLACGTGSAASAVIFALKNGIEGLVKVKTRSGETLKILFEKDNNKFQNLWLEGSAKIVYKGEYLQTKLGGK